MHMNLADEIEDIFTTYATHHRFSGVGLIKTQSSVIFANAFGYANRSWRVANTLETRFDTASITKLFTTVAILQLIDQQRLSLDTGVVDFLNLRDTTISKQVTVYHLLTHTSGIADDADEEAGEDYALLWRHKPNYSVRETRDFLPQFVHKPPVFAPGAGCRYNNVGFILLGLMIEALSGLSYREYVRTHIFEPLGMHQTAFISMDGVVDRVAEGYSPIYDAGGGLSGWRKNIYDYPPHWLTGWWRLHHGHGSGSLYSRLDRRRRAIGVSHPGPLDPQSALPRTPTAWLPRADGILLSLLHRIQRQCPGRVSEKRRREFGRQLYS